MTPRGTSKRALRAGSLAALACAALAVAPAHAAETTFERLVNPEPQNWLNNHHDYSARRFSALDAINRDNVKNLKLAFAIGLGRHLEQREPGGDAAGRGWLHVHGGQLGHRVEA
jgi:alcohol dehydrogenase (cytochrome c)